MSKRQEQFAVVKLIRNYIEDYEPELDKKLDTIDIRELAKWLEGMGLVPDDISLLNLAAQIKCYMKGNITSDDIIS